MPASLPDFRDLVLDVYANLDPAVHAVIGQVPRGVCNLWSVDLSGLIEAQAAEVRRFVSGDYDVVLGMLERRLDNQSLNSRVRRRICDRLGANAIKPAPIHRALMRLADRGASTTIVTTNFDRLLESVRRRSGPPVQSYSLGAIPRPTRQPDFSGVLHIHGSLAKNGSQASEMVLSEQDFGEYYLRRRSVPDFIYDAARLFNLVLVGYSANDAPMRYLLNAVAADGGRFDDLKERFTFFGTTVPDPVALEDWKGRGITPIYYSARNNHSLLSDLLFRWAELSPINGNKKKVDSDIRRIVRLARTSASDSDRDLFDHLIRRSDTSERVRLAKLASSANAEIGWLGAIVEIAREKQRGSNR